MPLSDHCQPFLVVYFLVLSNIAELQLAFSCLKVFGI